MARKQCFSNSPGPGTSSNLFAIADLPEKEFSMSSGDLLGPEFGPPPRGGAPLSAPVQGTFILPPTESFWKTGRRTGVSLFNFLIAPTEPPPAVLAEGCKRILGEERGTSSLPLNLTVQCLKAEDSFQVATCNQWISGQHRVLKLDRF